MVKYLTKEWLEAGMHAVNTDPEIREAAKNLNAIFLHVVTEPKLIEKLSQVIATIPSEF